MGINGTKMRKKEKREWDGKGNKRFGLEQCRE